MHLFSNINSKFFLWSTNNNDINANDGDLCDLFPGYGGLALSIEGPSKVDIQTEDMEDGTCRVTYCPTEPGNYIVSIRFAEEHVPGREEQK